MPNILYQFPVNAPAEKVFEALTSPAGLNAWWTLEADGRPELGATYRLYFGPHYDWRAQVKHVVPDRALTWQMTEAMDDWLPTQVGFTLDATETGCIVRFCHGNWQDEGDHFAVSTYCWGQLLRGLKEFVETGAIVPFDKRN